MLGIRLLLAYEFGVAGLEKRRGENGFVDIQEALPFPFSMVPLDSAGFSPAGPSFSARRR